MRRVCTCVIALGLAAGLSACGDKASPAKAPAKAGDQAASLSADEIKAVKASVTPENAEAEADKLLAEIEADTE